MSIRILAICILSGFACACEGSQWGRQGTARDWSGTLGEAPPVEDPVPPELPQCGWGAVLCPSEFRVLLEAPAPWPLGRYFLRVSADRGPRRVCEVAFEAVVGAVTDTCTDPSSGFRVTYRYDDENRAVEEVVFVALLGVDLEILTAEDLPPVVQVHHDIRVPKCSYHPCAEMDTVPLVAKVELGAAALPAADAGQADAGQDASDASAPEG